MSKSLLYASYKTAQRFELVTGIAFHGFDTKTFITVDGKTYDPHHWVPDPAIWTASLGEITSVIVDKFNILIQPLNCWDTSADVDYIKDKPTYFALDMFIYDPEFCVANSPKFTNYLDAVEGCVLAMLDIIEKNGLKPIGG